MFRAHGATLGASIPAALTAVVLCCAAPQTSRPDYFVIKQRGVPVGWLELTAAGLRRDAEGPFLVTRCRAHVRRWADGRGVLEEEMTLVAARRPGQPAYCIAGRWPRGSFRYRAADLPAAERAMLDFAWALTKTPEQIGEEHREPLRKAGWSDRDIWDIAAVAAFFNMSNRMAAAPSREPNPQYHAMAR